MMEQISQESKMVVFPMVAIKESQSDKKPLTNITNNPTTVLLPHRAKTESLSSPISQHLEQLNTIIDKSPHCKFEVTSKNSLIATSQLTQPSVDTKSKRINNSTSRIVLVSPKDQQEHHQYHYNQQLEKRQQSTQQSHQRAQFLSRPSNNYCYIINHQRFTNNYHQRSSIINCP